MRLRIPLARFGRAWASGWCGALLLVFCGAIPTAPAANQTLVPLGANWRFFATGEAAEPGWTLAAFNDSTWGSGLAKIGTGHSDHTTFLPAPVVTPRMAIYFRRHLPLLRLLP